MKQKKQLNRWNDDRPAGNYFLYVVTATLLLASCQKEGTPPARGNNEGALHKQSSRAPDLVVHPGGSIQAALNSAKAGATIKIQAGTYQESITVNKPGITLRGDGEVTLQNPGGATIGINVEDAADGFSLDHITVRDFEERGVQINHVDGFVLSHVTVINNGEFGLFSEYCQNGLIEHCEGRGHAETAVFVGQSSHVAITRSRGYDNVIGFEVENSSDVSLDRNHAYNNAVGMMCLLVPERLTGESSRISLTKNEIRQNNHPNFSQPPEAESVLPTGIGILLLGVNQTEVRDNRVTDNQFTGVAVVSTLLMAALANLPPEAFESIEPNPDGVTVISNFVKGNGTIPPAGLPFPGADLLWDGSGTGNCWGKNLYLTSYPSALPACQ